VKGLTFKTEWIEYPNIAAFYKEHGIQCVSERPDGSPLCTLPLIHDGSTNKYIVDSYQIAAYLDSQYPSTPTILPKGLNALQTAFEYAIFLMAGAFAPITLPATHSILNEESQDYFYRTKGIEKVKLREDQMDEQWRKFEATLGVIDGWLKMNDDGQKFISGDSISYVAISLAARIMWMKKVLNGNKGWERIREWHGGRWARLIAEFEQYE
jgi:glutathione S-transferase